MAYSKTETAVWQLAEPIAAESGFYIYDIEYIKEGGLWFLRVYIDKDDGITMDECEAFSRTLSDTLDEANPISGNYYLEVSSPGIERRLKTEAHFRRYIGSVIDISLYKTVNGSKLITGILKKYENNEIAVEADGEDILLPLSSVSKANLHFDF